VPSPGGGGDGCVGVCLCVSVCMYARVCAYAYFCVYLGWGGGGGNSRLLAHTLAQTISTRAHLRRRARGGRGGIGVYVCAGAKPVGVFVDVCAGISARACCVYVRHKDGIGVRARAGDVGGYLSVVDGSWKVVHAPFPSHAWVRGCRMSCKSWKEQSQSVRTTRVGRTRLTQRLVVGGGKSKQACRQAVVGSSKGR